MALQDVDVVDIVAKSLENIPNGLELYIVDNHHTNNEIERYKLLTDKLGAYVHFIASDEFKIKNPNTQASDVVIRVLCQSPPNEAMLEIISVMPHGDNTNRVQVIFENLEEFLSGQFTPITQLN
jgi:hypothetical protein